LLLLHRLLSVQELQLLVEQGRLLALELLSDRGLLGSLCILELLLPYPFIDGLLVGFSVIVLFDLPLSLLLQVKVTLGLFQHFLDARVRLLRSNEETGRLLARLHIDGDILLSWLSLGRLEVTIRDHKFVFPSSCETNLNF